MKKILFTLLAATLLLASCSSDNDVINNDNDNINSKKYTVNLNVKSTGFDIDKTPLSTRGVSDSRTYLQIVVYKESGEPYLNKVFLGDSIQKDVNADGSFHFSLELPEGKYHLAFIDNPISVTLGNGSMKDLEGFLLQPKNFYTDIEPARGLIGSRTVFPAANIGNYYQTIDLSVDDTTQNENIPVVLDPMWSKMFLTINNFKSPTNATYIRLAISYQYTGYQLANKIAPNNWDVQYVKNPPVNDNTLSTSFYISKSSTEKSNMKIVIEWYRYTMSSLIMTKEINFSTLIENGYYYKVKGKLDDMFGSKSIGITFEPFNDEEINLPFE